MDEDENYETVFPLPFWFLLLCGALFSCTGCASAESVTSVCFMKVMGATEDGFTVVGQTCVTPEVFAESQK